MPVSALRSFNRYSRLVRPNSVSYAGKFIVVVVPYCILVLCCVGKQWHWALLGPQLICDNRYVFYLILWGLFYYIYVYQGDE